MQYFIIFYLNYIIYFLIHNLAWYMYNVALFYFIHNLALLACHI